jgi:hypothetical protein
VENLKFSFSVLTGVIVAASATYGFVRTAKCRAGAPPPK